MSRLSASPARSRVFRRRRRLGRCGSGFHRTGRRRRPPARSKFPDRERTVDVGDALLRRLRAVPGVIAATPVESEPYKGETFFITKIAPADLRADERANSPFIPFEVGDEDYFRTFEIPILRGRGFLATDTKSAEKVVVLSEALARKFWPNGRLVERYHRRSYARHVRSEPSVDPPRCPRRPPSARDVEHRDGRPFARCAVGSATIERAASHELQCGRAGAGRDRLVRRDVVARPLADTGHRSPDSTRRGAE